MQIIVGSNDRYLSTTFAEIIGGLDSNCIRTNKLERITKELKQPGRLIILDLNWKDLHEPGLLRQLVNIGKITGNKVICVCPNQEDKLKKLAKSARPERVFLRYDLYTEFKEYLSDLLIMLALKTEAKRSRTRIPA